MIGYGFVEYGILFGFGIELLGLVFRYFGWLYVVMGWGGFFFNIDNVYLL